MNNNLVDKLQARRTSNSDFNLHKTLFHSKICRTDIKSVQNQTVQIRAISIECAIAGKLFDNI